MMAMLDTWRTGNLDEDIWLATSPGIMKIRVASWLSGSPHYRWGVWLDNALKGRGYAEGMDDALSQAHDCIDPDEVSHIEIHARDW